MRTFTIIVGLIASVSGNFRKCDKENLNELNSCMLEMMNQDLRPRIPAGVPEWGIPAGDPWTYKTSVSYKIGDFTNTCSDMQMRGIAKIQMNSFSVDPVLMTAKLHATLPELRLTGQYNLNGQIFTLKVDGQGPFWSIISNVSATIEQKLAVIENDGVKTLRVESNKGDIQFSKIRSRLNKLFNGDPVLGETVNAFVNENYREYADNFKPALSEPFINVFNEAVIRMLNVIPVEKFLRMI